MKSSYTAKILEDFSKKRLSAIAESERRTTEVQAFIPEIFKIDKALSSTSINIMAAAMSGNDVEEKIAAIKEENSKLRAERKKLLVKNGYPEDYTDIKFECSLCNDTGFIGINMCSCLKKLVALGAFHDSGIGELVKKQSFETFSFDYYTEDALKFAKMNYNTLKEFAEGFSKGESTSFILMGNTGLGKTHLSTSVAKTVIENGFKVVYDTISNIMADFEAQRFRGTLSEDDIRDRYYDCDLLIIDDLGCEVTNQFTVSCVYNLLNTRINSARSTIINTNLTHNELREKYADRITSRIFGEFRPLLFKGQDIRYQKLTR